MRTICRLWVWGLAASAVSVTAHAQGVLSVTPGRVLTTTAGTGAVGYSSSNVSAASASFASPTAIVYDAAGNIFIADTNNHVIREILKSNGSVLTVAGSELAGFSGDGGAANAAQLDTPTGIALDGSGNLFIADSHNHRIRKVAGGVITTVAGTGTAGFSGDGGPASSAQLSLPSAVTVDRNGRLLIADTNNQRIRAVTSGVITTLAGNGEQMFSGDGGQALAASLDQPTGVAVDASGNIYIADKHNQRIRMVNTAGVISTFAGSGGPTFAGAFGGDGSAATAASFSWPVGVSVDSNGNVLIADTDNQRIRQVSGSTIATLAGSGMQGFSGDGGSLTSSDLNSPKSVVTDSQGNLLLADTLNQRLRSSALPTLTFASTAVGATAPVQSITLANSGNASLTISQASLSTSFAIAAGGTCSGLPITLAPGASCTENVTFVPVASGAASGSVTVGGAGLVPQTVLLAGLGVQGSSGVTLTASASNSFVGQAITFTATVQPSGQGTIVFLDGSTPIGTAQALVNGVASLTLTNLAVGTHSISAVYSGDTNFASSTSAALSELVGDFNFSITSGSSGAGSSADSTNQTVVPGRTATYAFTIQPVGGPFVFPVTLSATGLPPGATVTFSPQTVTVGAAPTSFTMAVTTTAAVARLNRTTQYRGGTLAFALLLLPLSGSVRRRSKQLGAFTLSVAFVGAGIVLTTLTGCGSSNGFFGQAQKTYTIQVVGTATNVSGSTLQHVANVQLTLQ